MVLVELTKCWNSFEAELLKGALESEGIPCMLKGVGFSSVEIGNGGFGASAYTIPVLVREEDLEEAKKILEQNANTKDSSEKK